jgi:hypothetical protein
MACFSRINRAMDAPIGPTPYWMARIFFFKGFLRFLVAAGAHGASLGAKENLTIKEFGSVGNRMPRRNLKINSSAFGVLEWRNCAVPR